MTKKCDCIPNYYDDGILSKCIECSSEISYYSCDIYRLNFYTGKKITTCKGVISDSGGILYSS